MASDNQDLGLARTYSKAMLELAERRGQAESLGEELADLVALLGESATLATFLGSPLVSEAERRQVLEKAFRGKGSDLFVDSLQVINRKGRASLFGAIAASYRDELRQLRGQVEAKVRTAVPLSEGTRGRVLEAVRRFTGKEPLLVETVDPKLLGGVVIEVGGQKIDTSVASHLRELSDAFLGRASREIQRGTASYTGE
jgi:F-type H+-transporting ATPase subunit delta